MNLRIGIDIGKALGPLDGVGRYARGLLAGLVELEASLPEVDRFTYILYPLFRGSREHCFEKLFRDAGHRFRVCSPPESGSPRTGDIDVFHCMTHSVPLRFGGPLVFSVYDLTFLTLPETHTLDNRLHCALGLSRALVRGARLCAISENTRRDLVCELAIADDIEVVPPSVDRRFAPQGVDALALARAELGIEGSYVFSLGSLEPRKSVGDLIEAYAALNPELREKYQLVVAGAHRWEGTRVQESIADRISRLGIAHRVLLPGAVADELLPALYSGASVFVYPSLYEGFGLPPLEAMACGAPTIVSDRGALPEVVGGAAEVVVSGDTVELAAAMTRILSSPERSSELALGGPNQAAQYDALSSARRMREIYRRVAGGGLES